MSSFGDDVRGLRLRHGLSQEELAQRTGIAVRGLRNIEAGRVTAPRPATVRRLADAFRLADAERDAFVAAALVRDPPDRTGAPARVDVPAQLLATRPRPAWPACARPATGWRSQMNRQNGCPAGSR